MYSRAVEIGRLTMSHVGILLEGGRKDRVYSNVPKENKKSAGSVG